MELMSRCSRLSCVSPANADTSEIPLLTRLNCSSCVSPANADTSEIVLLIRYSSRSCVSPANANTSEIPLLTRSNPVRKVAYSQPDRSLIWWLMTESILKFSIVCVVIAVPGAWPTVLRTADAKFASCIDITLGRGSRGIILIGWLVDEIFLCASTTWRVTTLVSGFNPVVTNSIVSFGFPLNRLQAITPSGTRNCAW